MLLLAASVRHPNRPRRRRAAKQPDDPAPAQVAHGGAPSVLSSRAARAHRPSQSTAIWIVSQAARPVLGVVLKCPESGSRRREGRRPVLDKNDGSVLRLSQPACNGLWNEAPCSQQLLIAVGLYQWTPLKNACLRYCQSPLLFISRYGGFRPDARSNEHETAP